jgi:DNA-binding response OmpR family regulator
VTDESSHTILLVEDHPQSQTAYGKLLSGWGFAHKAAGSCAEAQALFETGAFACSLIDLGLPDGNGIDLLTDFSSRDPNLVNIVLSGDGSADSIIETMRGGVFDYLRKPLKAADLKQALHRALTHHEAVRQRAVLNQLLLEERQQLKLKIEEATRELRQYANTCEASNAQLSALIHLTQIASSGLQNESDLFRGVLEEIAVFIPIYCVAFQNGPHGEFVSAYRLKDGQVAIIQANGNGAPAPDPQHSSSSHPDASILAAIAQHTDLDPATFLPQVFPQVLASHPLSTVAMLFDGTFAPGTEEREFLGMCAHHIAAEWKMSRLLQHAARYTSLGSIALELSKTFVKSLTAIQLAADVLYETLESTESKGFLEIIPHNVSLLRDQIREFRSIANPRKDSLGTVRLDSLIEQALVVLSSAVQNRNVSIIREFKVDSRCVLLNGTALQRTFLELLSVALRGLRQGGHIILRISDEDKERIRFEIALRDEDQEDAPESQSEGVFARLQRRPGFLLAQRAIHGCAGRIIMGHNAEGEISLSIILPRDATRGHHRAGDRL